MIATILALSLTQLPTSRAQSECIDPAPLTAASKVSIERGRWAPDVHARLVSVIRRLGAGSPGYDPCKRPLAVIEWGGVIAAKTAGQLAVEAAGKVCDVEDCTAWPSKAFAGATSAELSIAASNLQPSLRTELVSLIDVLTDTGWDVFIVSSSPEWLVRELAPRVGLPPEQAIGQRTLRSRTGTISATLAPPIMRGAGKVIAIRTRISPGGRVPALAIGSTVADEAVLLSASHEAVLIGGSGLVKLGRAKGWALQPALP